MDTNQIEVDVSAAGRESILQVNAAIDELHNRLANLGSGRAGTSVATLEAQVNELRSTMGSFRGVGSSAVTELESLRRQLSTTLDALATVVSSKNLKGNIAAQYIELGGALQDAFFTLDKVYMKGVADVKAANTAMADEIGRNNRMVRKAISDAGQYTPYNARAVATFEQNAQKGSSTEAQLATDRAFHTAQDKMLADSLAKELGGYAELAAANIKARETQLTVDRVFFSTQEKMLSDALVKEINSFAVKEAAERKMREAQLAVDRTFYTAQDKMLSDHLIKELAGYAKSAEAAIAAKTAAQSVISNFRISGLSPLKQIELDANDAHSAVRGLASGFNAMFLTWGNIAPLLAGAAISNAFVQALKVGAQVQDNLLSIEHLAGATTEEIKVLSAAILDMGRSTQFGPVVLSEALKTLALAGLSAKDSLTALRPVLEFSVAGEIPIGKASESLVAISTAFGYGASGIATVADTIAKAAAVSMASVEGMTESFRAGSVVAQQYNVSLNDAALNLAFLSQIGIKGSAAGTALKNMYTELLSGSNKTKKALEELGVQAMDNVNGTKPFIEIISQLDLALARKTKTAQQSYLADAANNRGSKDIVAALQAYRTTVFELNGAIKTQIEEKKAAGDAEGAYRLQMAASLTVYQKVQDALEKSAGFTAIANAEKGLGATNIFEGLKASLQTDLLEAFNGISDIVTVVGKKLRDTFNSDEFRSGLDYLVLTVGKLTDVLVTNLPMIVKAGEAFVIYRGAALAASAVLATFAIAGTIATSLFDLGLAFMAVGEGVTVAGAALGVAGTALSTIFTPLRILTLTLTAAGLAWAFFADHAEKDSERAKRAIEANQVKQDQFNKSIDESIKGYEARRLARETGQRIDEILGQQEASAAKQRIIAIADESRVIEQLTLSEQNRRLALAGSSIVEQRTIKDGIAATNARIQNIDAERDKALASQDAKMKKLYELANAEKKYEDEKAKATRTMASGKEERPNTKAAKDALDAELTGLSKANAVLQQAIKTGQQETLDAQRAIAEQLVNDVAAVQAAYTKADGGRLVDLEKVNQEINRNQISEGEGQAKLNQLYLDGYSLQAKALDDTIATRNDALQRALATEAIGKAMTLYKMNLEKENIEQQIAGAEKLAGINKKDPENNKKVEQYRGDLAKLEETIKTVGATTTAYDKLIGDNAKANIATTQQKIVLQEKYSLELEKQITAATKEQKIAADASKNRAKTTTEIQYEAVAQAEITAQLTGQKYAQDQLNTTDAEAVELSRKKALAAWEVYQALLETLTVDQSIKSDWISAAIKGLKTYREGLYDVAKIMSETVTHSITLLEDAFTDMLLHGKLSFKGLADYALSQLARIVAQQVFIQPLLSYLTGDSGSPGSAGGSGGSGAMGLIGAGATANSLYTSYKAGTGVFGLFGGGGAATSTAYSAPAASGYVGESMWAGSSGATVAAPVAEGAVATGGAAGAAETASTMGPYGWIAAAVIVALSVLTAGNGGIPTANTGSAANLYDKSGNMLSQETFYGGSSENTDKIIGGMQQSYQDIAKKLDINTVETRFAYLGNTGKDGKSPNFGLSGTANGSDFTQSETPLDEASLQLASSKAVLAALRGSELPRYLQGIFDTIDLNTASQQDVDNLMSAAEAVKAFHEAVAKLPFDSLKNLDFKGIQGLASAAGSLSNLQGLLGGFFDKFYTDAEKAATSTDYVGEVFKSLNITVPETMAEFRKIVEDSFKDTTAEGQAASVKLLGVSDAFATLHASATTSIADIKAVSAAMVTAFNAAKDAVDAARDSLSNAQDAAKTHLDELNTAVDTAQTNLDSVIGNIQSSWASAQSKVDSAQAKINSLAQQSATQMTAFTKSLKDFLHTLDTTTLGAGSPESIYNANKALYQTTAAKAAGGDTTAINDLANIAKAFLESSKDYNATNTQFAADVDAVRNGVGGVAGYTASKSGSTEDSLDTIAQAQQDLLDAQAELLAIQTVAKAAGVTTSTTVHDYLAEWRKAKNDLDNATATRDRFQDLVGSLLARAVDEDAHQRQLLQAILNAQNGLTNAILLLAQAQKPLERPTADATGGGVTYTSSGGAVAHSDSGGNITITGTSGNSASLDQVQGYIDALLQQNDLLGIYNLAKTEGLSSTSLAHFLHGAVTPQQIDQWAYDQGLAALPGIPTHAKGGRQDSGVAWVGENGPELIDFTTPGRVYSSSNSAAMVSGANSEQAAATQANSERMAATLEAGNRHVEQSNMLLKAVYKKLGSIDRAQRLDNSKPQQQPKAR